MSSRGEGHRGSIVSSTPVCCGCDGIAAGCSGMSCLSSLSHPLTSAGLPASVTTRPNSPSSPRRSPLGGARRCAWCSPRRAARGELSLIAPDGTVAMRSRSTAGRRISGSPRSSLRPRERGARGSRAAARAECRSITREIAVRADAPPRPSSVAGSVWPLRNTWNRGTENLFRPDRETLRRAARRRAVLAGAACRATRSIAQPPVQPSGSRRRRDEDGLSIAPTCRISCARISRSDGPAVRLLEVHARRRRQAAGVHPVVEHSNVDGARAAEPLPPPGAPAVANASAVPAVPPRSLGLAGSFGAYMRTVGDGVHSGSARTATADNNTDYYPVSLNQETLRPGTIYADPYGHILMLVRRVPQSEGGAGVFLAVDGQPTARWRASALARQFPVRPGSSAGWPWI